MSGASRRDRTGARSVRRAPKFRGRRDVLDALIDLVGDAADGRGGALTVVGEPGIGKTTVLDAAAGVIARKQRTARVVRMRGVEARVERPWSGLAALVDDLGGLDCLAPARAVAVRTALSMEGTNAAVEPFAVALGARDLLVNAAESGPVVLFVDDLQWVDLATRRTLSFVARRLQFERVAMVSTRRSGTDPVTDTGPVALPRRCPRRGGRRHPHRCRCGQRERSS